MNYVPLILASLIKENHTLNIRPILTNSPITYKVFPYEGKFNQMKKKMFAFILIAILIIVSILLINENRTKNLVNHLINTENLGEELKNYFNN